MTASDEAEGLLPGSRVEAANGETIGTVRAVFPHFLLVADEVTGVDYDIPQHAINRYEDGTIYLMVNREALTAFRDDATERRLGPEEPT